MQEQNQINFELSLTTGSKEKVDPIQACLMQNRISDDKKLAEELQIQEYQGRGSCDNQSTQSSIFSQNRKGIDTNLSQIISLPAGCIQGEAIDDGGCFFDALAQILNLARNTDIYNEKYLRFLCHEFYSDSKELVNEWNKKDYGGIDKSEAYYLVQYTKPELDKDFNKQAPIWGRPNVEGKILCKSLGISKLLVIEILKDPETNKDIPHFILVSADEKSESNSIAAEEGNTLLEDQNVPTLVVSQKSLHFVPLLKNNQSKDENLKVIGKNEKQTILSTLLTSNPTLNGSNTIKCLSPDIIHPTNPVSSSWAPQATAADGDCAFHAIFGQLNSDRYHCADVSKKRDELSKRVASSEAGSTIHTLAIEGIANLVAGNVREENQYQIDKQYTQLIALCENYKNYKPAETLEELKQDLENNILQVSSVLNYINANHTLKKQEASLYEKYHNVLNSGDKDIELLNRIRSYPALEKAKQDLDKFTNAPFIWKEHISTNVLNDYANFIGTSGQWLAPKEIELIAKIFDVKIAFHTKANNSNKYVYVSTYEKAQSNQEQSQVIHVGFDGRGHFERLMSEPIRTTHSSFSAPDITSDCPSHPAHSIYSSPNLLEKTENAPPEVTSITTPVLSNPSTLPPQGKKPNKSTKMIDASHPPSQTVILAPITEIQTPGILRKEETTRYTTIKAKEKITRQNTNNALINENKEISKKRNHVIDNISDKPTKKSRLMDVRPNADDLRALETESFISKTRKRERPFSYEDKNIERPAKKCYQKFEVKRLLNDITHIKKELTCLINEIKTYPYVHSSSQKQISSDPEKLRTKLEEEYNVFLIEGERYNFKSYNLYFVKKGENSSTQYQIKVCKNGEWQHYDLELDEHSALMKLLEEENFNGSSCGENLKNFLIENNFSYRISSVRIFSEEKTFKWFFKNRNTKINQVLNFLETLNDTYRKLTNSSSDLNVSFLNFCEHVPFTQVLDFIKKFNSAYKSFISSYSKIDAKEIDYTPEASLEIAEYLLSEENNALENTGNKAVFFLKNCLQSDEKQIIQKTYCLLIKIYTKGFKDIQKDIKQALSYYYNAQKNGIMLDKTILHSIVNSVNASDLYDIGIFYKENNQIEKAIPCFRKSAENDQQYIEVIAQELKQFAGNQNYLGIQKVLSEFYESCSKYELSNLCLKTLIPPYKSSAIESSVISSDEEEIGSDVSDVELPDSNDFLDTEEKSYTIFADNKSGIYSGTVNQEFCPEGLGIYYSRGNNESYIGQWSRNEKHGFGQLLDGKGSRSGNFYHGDFQEGDVNLKFDPPNEIESKRYNGKMKDGKFHGLGKLVYKKKEEVNVEWRLTAHWEKNKVLGKPLENEIEKHYQESFENFFKELDRLFKSDSIKGLGKILYRCIVLLSTHILDANLLDAIRKNTHFDQVLIKQANDVYQLRAVYDDLIQCEYINTKPRNFIDEFSNHCFSALQEYCMLLFERDKANADTLNRLVRINKIVNFSTKNFAGQVKKAIESSVVEGAKRRIDDFRADKHSESLVNSLKKKIEGFNKSNSSIEKKIKNYYLIQFFNALFNHTVSPAFVPQLQLTVSSNLTNNEKELTDYYKERSDYVNNLWENIVRKKIHMTDSHTDFFMDLYCSGLYMQLKLRDKVCKDKNLIEKLYNFLNVLLKPEIINPFSDKLYNESQLLEVERNFEIEHSDIKNHKERIIVWLYAVASPVSQNQGLKELIFAKKQESVSNETIETIKQNCEYIIAVIICTDLLDEIKRYRGGKLISSFLQKLVNSNTLNNDLLESISHFLKQYSEFRQVFKHNFGNELDKKICKKCFVIIDKFLKKLLQQSCLEQSNENNINTSNPIFLKQLHELTEFLNQLKSCDLSWYVKEENKTCLKKTIKERKKMVKKMGETQHVEEHWGLKTIHDLLVIIDTFLKVDELEKKENALLIALSLSQVIGKSLSAFAMQPQYTSLQEFYNDSLRLFKGLERYLDFENPHQEIESYLEQVSRHLETTRQTVTMDITQALSSFNKKRENCQGIEITKERENNLKSLYEIYKEKLNQYLQRFIRAIDNQKDIGASDNQEKREKVKKAIVSETIAEASQIGDYYDYYCYRVKMSENISRNDILTKLTSIKNKFSKSESPIVFVKVKKKLKYYIVGINTDDTRELTIKKIGETYHDKCNQLFNFYESEKKRFNEICSSSSKSIARTLINNLSENRDRKVVEYLMEILAGLSFILTTNVSAKLIQHLKSSQSQENKSQQENLKENLHFPQPHIIQILGIMMCLDVGHKDKQFKISECEGVPFERFMQGTPNSLSEILTGQGKSWAITLLSGIFLLMRYQVTVSCYSSYLTDRDECDFKSFMKQFNFNENAIRYKTLDAICEEKLAFNIKEGEKDCKLSVRELVKEIVQGGSTREYRSIPDQIQKKHILINDEVDVLLSDKLQEMYHGCATAFVDHLKPVQHKIWERIKENDVNELNVSLVDKINGFLQGKLTDEIKKIVDSVGDEFFQEHLKDMIAAAFYVKTAKEEEKNKYSLDLEKNAIFLKDENGKFREDIINGYLNSFFYLQKLEQSKRSINFDEPNKNFLQESEQSDDSINFNKPNKNFGYFYVDSGQISYAMLPEVKKNNPTNEEDPNAQLIQPYAHLFGFTGSLYLTDSEKSILKESYNLEAKNFSYFCSFYGERKLCFDETKHCMVCKNEEEWFHQIFKHAHDVLKQGRCVLIFFEAEKELMTFKNDFSSSFEMGKLHFVTENVMSNIHGGEEKQVLYNDTDFNRLIESDYSGREGHVTLLTASFGRGIDFKVSHAVLTKGGAHAIQTFFSLDLKEQIQIQGRVARKYHPGSYEIILNFDFLKEEPFKLSQKPSKEDAYAQLNIRRQELMNQKFSQAEDIIKENRTTSLKALGFFRTHLNSGNELTSRTDCCIPALKELRPSKTQATFFSKKTLQESRTVILIDGTGSMGGTLNGVKNCVEKMFSGIRAALLSEDSTCKDRVDSFYVQIVIYRNYNSTLDNSDGKYKRNEQGLYEKDIDQPMVLNVSAWTNSAQSLQQFMSSKRAETSGGAGPEAIEVGIWHVNDILRRGINVSQLILIGDIHAHHKNADIFINAEDFRKNTLPIDKQYPVQDFDTEIAILKDQKNSPPIHTFYVETKNNKKHAEETKKKFEGIKEKTNGTRGSLEISDNSSKEDQEKNAKLLQDTISERILRDIGGKEHAEELVEIYKKQQNHYAHI